MQQECSGPRVLQNAGDAAATPTTATDRHHSDLSEYLPNPTTSGDRLRRTTAAMRALLLGALAVLSMAGGAAAQQQQYCDGSGGLQTAWRSFSDPSCAGHCDG